MKKHYTTMKKERPCWSCDAPTKTRLVFQDDTDLSGEVYNMPLCINCSFELYSDATRELMKDYMDGAA